MDDDRIKHSLAVAKKMVEIASNIGLSNEKIGDCFLIGLNHDVGYEKRLEEIKKRYGDVSEEYKNSKKLINLLNK